MQVADGGQHIEVDPVVARGGLGSAARLPPPAEIDGHGAESGLRQCLRLHRPTLLVEPASVSQHDAVVARAVHVGVDDAPVLRRKGDAFLRLGGDGGDHESNHGRFENRHAAISLVR
jgi:hypothetical protein